MFAFTASSAIKPGKRSELRFGRLSEESTASSDWSSDDSFEGSGELLEPSGIALPLSPAMFTTISQTKHAGCFGALLSKCGLGITYR